MKGWNRLVIVLLFFLLPMPVWAVEEEQGSEVPLEVTLEEAAAALDTRDVDAAVKELGAETDFSKLMEEVLSGEFDFSFSGWRQKLYQAAFGELQMQGKLLTQLLLVVILSAILRQLSASFRGKSVGEMGFYLCYVILVAVLLSAFYEIAACVVERMTGICRVFRGMVPLFLLLSGASGKLMEGAWMGPTLLGGSALLSEGIRRILVPGILLAIGLELADHISERPILGRFSALLRQGLRWGMKGTAMGFMLLLSLQKIGGAATNGLATRTAKIVVGAVPIVGDIMGGTVEAAAAVFSTLKSGVLVTAAVLLLLLCLPLLVKLLVIWLVFRLTAAASEFICEERLVDCISAAGEYTGLLLGIVFLGEGMFLFSALLLLGGW